MVTQLLPSIWFNTGCFREKGRRREGRGEGKLVGQTVQTCSRVVVVRCTKRCLPFSLPWVWRLKHIGDPQIIMIWNVGIIDIATVTMKTVVIYITPVNLEGSCSLTPTCSCNIYCLSYKVSCWSYPSHRYRETHYISCKIKWKFPEEVHFLLVILTKMAGMS